MNLVKFQEADHGEQPKASIQTLEQFNQMLNEQPDPKELKVNKFAGNSKYLPISYVQVLLDEFFVGLWRTKNFSYSVVANEIVGNITLEYFHPFAKMWIEREGAAAVQIQQKKGADITDISAKITNTLGKDHPHLMASCIASAARTIGKKFGRDLNREHTDEYSSMYSEIAASEAATETIEWDKVTTLADLNNIWKQHPDMHSNKHFVKKFTYQKNRITTQKRA